MKHKEAKETAQVPADATITGGSALKRWSVKALFKTKKRRMFALVIIVGLLCATAAGVWYMFFRERDNVSGVIKNDTTIVTPTGQEASFGDVSTDQQVLSLMATASIYQHQEKYQESLDLMRKAEQIAGNNVTYDFYFQMSQLHADMKNARQARQYADRAITAVDASGDLAAEEKQGMKTAIQKFKDGIK